MANSNFSNQADPQEGVIDRIEFTRKNAASVTDFCIGVGCLLMSAAVAKFILSKD